MLKAIIMCSSLLVAGVAAAQPAQAPQPKQKMLEKFDVNKDGKLDQTERVAMREERAAAAFKRLDKDGDGKLSFAEFKQGKRFGKRHHFGARRGFRHGLKSR